MSRRKLNVKFTSSRTYLHSSGVIISSRGEELKILTNACRWNRAESTLQVIAFDFCFIKASGSVSGLAADEGATCLVLVDVGTGYLDAVPAAAKTVTDYLVEGVRRFVEQFFRRRVRLRCDGERATVPLARKLKESGFVGKDAEARQSGESCGICYQDACGTRQGDNWILRNALEPSC